MANRDLIQQALDDLSCLIHYAERAGQGYEIAWADVAADIGVDAKKAISTLRIQLAQPTWVGLTDEEINKAYLENEDWRDFVAVIETKLKDKNYGT